MWRRMLLQRLARWEALFALSFSVLLAGVITLTWGIALSGPSAFPELGIVLIAIGAYVTAALKPPRPAEGGRSALRTLGRGYVQIWHWIRPPRR
ncbi:MAG: hypothetical protein ACC660_01490 [Acidimicrobiales bacterium]